MNAIPFVIGHDLKDLSETFVFFSNLAHKPEITKNLLEPFITSVRQGIESYFKVPSKITYHSMAAAQKNHMCDFLQFSDIVVRFRHADRGFEFFLIVGSNLARTLLCRLLSTTLIEDSLGLLFSSTEKGIFSFVTAKLLYEIKLATDTKLPNIKIIGVYNSQDHAIKELQIDGHGTFNFSIFLADQQYPLALILPALALEQAAVSSSHKDHLLSRCGFLLRPLSIRLASLTISFGALKSLEFGDVIIFDYIKQSFSQGILSGQANAHWDEYFFNGDVITKDNQYLFCLKDPILWAKQEEAQVEQINISDAKNSIHSNPTKNQSHAMANLASNIRVNLNVELSRLPMTLKDICELREGTIIDLKRKLDDPLELVVEGRVIGHCTPLKINGRLGIKILQLVDQNDDATH